MSKTQQEQQDFLREALLAQISMKGQARKNTSPDIQSRTSVKYIYNSTIYVHFEKPLLHKHLVVLLGTWPVNGPSII